jgi:SAM-dependent methyltransferase
MSMEFWDARFDTPEYIFGTLPNRFLAAQAARLHPGMRALAVADGEGRNGVWLAQQGLTVHAVDGSTLALDKARKLAAERGVSVEFELADLLTWTFPENAYDVVAGIFFQFAPPPARNHIIEGIRTATAPGGLVILQGYTPRQIGFGTGGPSNPEQMWTADLLRQWFDGWHIEHLEEHDEALDEGHKHKGMSAVVDMVARKP